MNSQKLTELLCIESSSKDSFTQLIQELSATTIHTENALITLPNSTTYFGLSIEGDQNAGIDILSLYCAQKGIVWGEFTTKKLYLSDGNVLPIESCCIHEYE